MTHEFTPRIQALCGLIAQEKDPRKFIHLVEELNQLLAEKDQQLCLKPAVGRHLAIEPATDGAIGDRGMMKQHQQGHHCPQRVEPGIALCRGNGDRRIDRQSVGGGYECGHSDTPARTMPARHLLCIEQAFSFTYNRRLQQSCELAFGWRFPVLSSHRSC